MVVALDPEGGGDAVPHVDHTGVLARSHEDALALAREPSEVSARRLVRRVLGPHHRVHRQLEVVGRTAQDLLDVDGFVVGQAERPMQWFQPCSARYPSLFVLLSMRAPEEVVM